MSRRSEEPPLSGILSMTMDWRDGEATFVLPNGLVDSISLPILETRNYVVTKATYFPSLQELHSLTTFGDTVVTEVATTKHMPINGRPVIYLDQKDWSLLANVIHGPNRVDSAEEDAAQRLIALARDRRIILPMSMGHFTETAKWSNCERRYCLALTMLKLSRGWQLRNPSDIRLYELMRSMLSSAVQRTLPQVDMITLEGCSAQPGLFSRQLLKSTSGFSPNLAMVVDTLTCISSQIEALLDWEPVPMGEIDGWVESEQHFTDWLAQQPLNADQKRKLALNYFVQDIGLELSEAANRLGLSTSEFSSWLTDHFLGDLPFMPHLSLYKELMASKHLDRTTRWRHSDLHDMMYLSCGAGYADYTVGEKSLISHIRGAARRNGKPLIAYTKISQLVDGLQEVPI